MQKKMKFLFLLIFAAVLCFLLPVPSVQAQVVNSGNCGPNANWTLESDGTLRISGTGRMRNYATYETPWFDYSNTITSLVIEDGIVSIGSYAFCPLGLLQKVTLPDSLVQIGEHAFSGCDLITRVDIPDLKKWCQIDFKGSSSNPLSGANDAILYEEGVPIHDLVIPEGLTAIVNYAFAGYGGIYELVIPQGITTIGEGAFSGCKNIDSLVIPSSVERIESSAFSGCSHLYSLTLPESVTSIGNGAFAFCSVLSDVTIPSSVVEMGTAVFEKCNSLERIVIPANVQAIRDYTFSNCKNLTDVVISEGITSIGSHAFSQCNRLQEITIPGSVSCIGDNAFFSCEQLRSVTLGEGVTELQNHVFSQCKNLQYITIPSSMQTIGSQAFLWCDQLAEVHIADLSAWCKISFDDYMANPLQGGGKLFLQGKLVDVLTIPQEITRIELYAFYNCSSITDVIVPDGVTLIRTYAFGSCDNLVSVTLPKSIAEIEYDAFSECGQLQHVLFAGTQSQWDSLQIGQPQPALLSATRHYSCAGGELSVAKSCAGDIYHCSLCNADFYTLQNIESHTWDDGTVTQKANCNTEGVRTYTCTGCGATKTESIKRTSGHSWRMDFVVSPPSCRTAGFQSYRCEVCSISKTKVMLKYPYHTWDNGKITREATCKKQGTITYTCSICSGTKTEFIDKLTTHSYDSGLCTVCNQKDPDYTGPLPPEVTEPQLEDLLIDCGSCGENVTWTLDSHGKLTISGTGAMNDYNYTTIPWYADRASITQVEIQEGVTYLGRRAFCGCPLTNVTIPASVTDMGEEALGSHEAPLNVYISDIAAWCGITKHTEFLNPKGHQINLYLDGALVTELIIPENVSSISSSVFAGCSSLISVTVPENVQIENKAFYACSNLSEVKLGAGVQIGAFAFSDCYELSNLTMEEGVTEIGDNAFLFCYRLTQVTLPESIVYIGSGAFRGCRSLTSISIPEGVPGIEQETFQSCEALTQVTLPASITYIKEQAFKNCDSLTTVRYAGSEDQWNAIDISFSNSILEEVSREYHYIAPDTPSDAADEGGGMDSLWLGIVAGVGLAGGVTFFVFYKKRKK